jgi:hypothetical protein
MDKFLSMCYIPLTYFMFGAITLAMKRFNYLHTPLGVDNIM